eukprot:jgi/Bigna1/90753/estExt_fgenesh1_pg.C_780073
MNPTSNSDKSSVSSRSTDWSPFNNHSLSGSNSPVIQASPNPGRPLFATLSREQCLRVRWGDSTATVKQKPASTEGRAGHEPKSFPLPTGNNSDEKLYTRRRSHAKRRFSSTSKLRSLSARPSTTASSISEAPFYPENCSGSSEGGIVSHGMKSDQQQHSSSMSVDISSQTKAKFRRHSYSGDDGISIDNEQEDEGPGMVDDSGGEEGSSKRRRRLDASRDSKSTGQQSEGPSDDVLDAINSRYKPPLLLQNQSFLDSHFSESPFVTPPLCSSTILTGKHHMKEPQKRRLLILRRGEQ